MSKLQLIRPNIEYRVSYLNMLEDWKRTGEKLVPFVLKYDPSDFAAMVQKLDDASRGIGVPDQFVPQTTFWLVGSSRRILGVVNIRHHLNESLLQRGGHIGYGVRPSERCKGYATEMLRLALAEAKKMGIRRSLVTCDKDNIASAKTILHNGGKLESEIIIQNEWVQRYWIDIE